MMNDDLAHWAAVYKSPDSHAAIMARYETALARWTHHYETRLVETRFGPTHVLVTGTPDGPPLLYFHGWGGNATDAHDTIPDEVFRYFRIYAPDTIGQQGKSAPTRPDPDGRAYADWIVDVMAGLSIQRACVTGHSGGGFLSLKLAAYYPERVEKVFAMSTAGLTAVVPLPLRFLMVALPFMLCPCQLTARLLVRHVLVRSAPDDIRQQMTQTLCATSRHYRRTAPGRLTDEELRRIQAPVYIIMGKHEILMRLRRLIKRAELIPQATVEIVSEAGHMLPVEKPHLIQERMLSFLDT